MDEFQPIRATQIPEDYWHNYVSLGLAELLVDLSDDCIEPAQVFVRGPGILRLAGKHTRHTREAFVRRMNEFAPTLLEKKRISEPLTLEGPYTKQEWEANKERIVNSYPESHGAIVYFDGPVFAHMIAFSQGTGMHVFNEGVRQFSRRPYLSSSYGVRAASYPIEPAGSTATRESLAADYLAFERESRGTDHVLARLTEKFYASLEQERAQRQ